MTIRVNEWRFDSGGLDAYEVLERHFPYLTDDATRCAATEINNRIEIEIHDSVGFYLEHIKDNAQWDVYYSDRIELKLTLSECLLKGPDPDSLWGDYENVSDAITNGRIEASALHAALDENGIISALTDDVAFPSELEGTPELEAAKEKIRDSAKRFFDELKAIVGELNQLE